MNTNAIESLADDMLWEHGLSDWSFKFDRAKVRLGACHHSTKTITLSLPLCEYASGSEITETLLHEIAHALVGPGVGHGSAWRRVALSIGSNGQRCHSVDVSNDARYVYECKCGTTHSWHRRPKDTIRRCTICGHRFRSKWVNGIPVSKIIG